jgi:hypothetical protein
LMRAGAEAVERYRKALYSEFRHENSLWMEEGSRSRKSRLLSNGAWELADSGSSAQKT